MTTIGTGAFQNNVKLKTVKLGGCVSVIGAQAFQNCTALTKITLPASLSKIGKEAFYADSKLKSITVKTTALTDKRVGARAFGKLHKKAVFTVPSKKLKAYKKLFKKKGVTGKKQKVKK